MWDSNLAVWIIYTWAPEWSSNFEASVNTGMDLDSFPNSRIKTTQQVIYNKWTHVAACMWKERLGGNFPLSNPNKIKVCKSLGQSESVIHLRFPKAEEPFPVQTLPLNTNYISFSIPFRNECRSSPFASAVSEVADRFLCLLNPLPFLL